MKNREKPEILIPKKQDGFQGFLLCMRLKRALMKRGAKIIFYGCFFANYQKNRI